MKTSNAVVLFGIAAALAGTIVVAFGAGWTPVTFTGAPISKVGDTFAVLLLLSLLIERALEVFLTLWRGPQSEWLEARIRQLGKDREDSAKKAAAETELPARRQELLDYKATTQRYALPFALVLGLLVATVGVRVLSQFVDVTTKSGLGPRQSGCFCWLDILLTGAMLAGGSDPIHRLMNLYRKFLDSTTSRASAP